MACGVLGWPPSAFWQSTMIELLDAVDQWVCTHGSGDEAEKLRYARFKDGLEETGIV